MRKFSMLLFIMFASFASCKKKPENIIADIMKHYKAINDKQKDYTVKHVDDITSAASGTITGYYRDDELKKIVAEHFTDSSRTFTEYYFDDGMLIFIFRQNFVYNCPMSYTEEKARAKGDSVWYDDKKTRLDIDKFYFNLNKMIRWVGPDDKEIHPQSTRFINKEPELWAETIVLMKELKEQ